MVTNGRVSVLHRRVILMFILLTVGQGSKNVDGQDDNLNSRKNAKHDTTEVNITQTHPGGDVISMNTTTASTTSTAITRSPPSAAVTFFTTPSMTSSTTTSTSTTSTMKSTARATTSSAFTTLTPKTTATKLFVSSTTKPSNLDPGSVVKLSVESTTGQLASKEVQFGLNVMKSLHSCLCNPQTVMCKIIHQSQVLSTPIANYMTLSPAFLNTYTCFLEQDINVTCSRVPGVEAAAVCPQNNCAADFTAFGPGCLLHFVNVVWRKDQKLFVDLWKTEVSSIFSCNASCWNADLGSGDDDVDNDQYNDDDDSVNPIIIGVVVAIGIIVVVIFLTIIVFVVLSRRKTKAGQRHRASTQALTNGGFESGHHILNSSHSSLEGDQGRIIGERYSVPEVGTKSIHVYNDPVVQDPGYAYIDEAQAGTKSEYSTLDEASQYRHEYKRASSNTSDPRLRPPLPLPKRTNSEPLPYYSVAKTFGDTNDASGQYLELIGDNSGTAQEKPGSGLTEAPLYGTIEAKGEGVKKNEYFELEKDNYVL
uniref:Uncharacterized protein n=1 Tax=Biomphalaria glabrata TaxID=6526 RepID=A0A2C9JUB8_BIOGL